MLESSMIEQLKTVFERLENPVRLVFDLSEQEKQEELLEMLNDVASTSPFIQAESSGNSSVNPRFSVHTGEGPNGISFVGVPGGHEFSSVILAILNSDGKGKLPDAGIVSRIKRLKGQIQLRTFISLSCENCPDVVQTLNLMATLNPGFTHEMIDGAFCVEEVEELGIQGVPSVMLGNKLLSSGKTGLVDLLKKLENEFGTLDQDSLEPVDLGDYDVVVVGGGPAGASSAIYASRKGLKTALVAERIGGQLQDTRGIENLISVPYTEGPELSARLAKHMEAYDIQILEHRRVKKIENEQLKRIQLDSGEFLRTRSIIMATGAKWREMGIPGEKEYIGRGVAFCPHCDGPYYKGKDIAVIGGGNSGVEAALDLAGIVRSVVLIEFLPELKADKVLVDKLMTLPNVRVLKHSRTTQVLGNSEKVIGLEYENRTTEKREILDLDGVFVQIGLMPNSQCVKDLVETNRFGEIVIDAKCRTSAPGIYAAGDVTTVPFKQIIISMGEGAKAALTAFEDQLVS